MWSRRYARSGRFYGIVDEETQEAVELYVRREDAERFLASGTVCTRTREALGGAGCIVFTHETPALSPR